MAQQETEKDGLTILKEIYAEKVADKNCPLNGEEIKKIDELYKRAERERDEDRGAYDDDGIWCEDTTRFMIMWNNAEKEALLVARLMGIDIEDLLAMTFEY